MGTSELSNVAYTTSIPDAPSWFKTWLPYDKISNVSYGFGYIDVVVDMELVMEVITSALNDMITAREDCTVIWVVEIDTPGEMLSIEIVAVPSPTPWATLLEICITFISKVEKLMYWVTPIVISLAIPSARSVASALSCVHWYRSEHDDPEDDDDKIKPKEVSSADTRTLFGYQTRMGKLVV